MRSGRVKRSIGLLLGLLEDPLHSLFGPVPGASTSPASAPSPDRVDLALCHILESFVVGLEKL